MEIGKQTFIADGQDQGRQPGRWFAHLTVGHQSTIPHFNLKNLHTIILNLT